jgi:hypothetical protein
MNVRTRLLAAGLALLALPAAACSSSSTPSATATTTAAAGAPTTTTAGPGGGGGGSSSGSVSATVNVTGDFTADGPLGGRIVCTASPTRIEFESQGDPRLDFVVTNPKNGTVTLLDAYKTLTGSVTYPAAGPKVETARIEGTAGKGQYLVTSGTMEIADGGAKVTVNADAAIAGQPDQKVHLQTTWQGCPTSSS